MNRDQISRLAHSTHPVASPLSDDAVCRLLEQSLPRGDEQVLDLGCGGGEWILRACVSHPQLHAVGVDVSDVALTHAQQTADRLGVQDRLTLHAQDAAKFSSAQAFDLVLSVGSAHAFGGLLPALDAARRHLAPGGRVLVGDGFWQHEPTAEAIEMLGNFADLAATMDRVVDDGWTPIGGHISTRQELDDYEWAWTGALASWALDHPDDPDGAQALEVATLHRTEWLRVYRETWGFVCLVLRRTHDHGTQR